MDQEIYWWVTRVKLVVMKKKFVVIRTNMDTTLKTIETKGRKSDVIALSGYLHVLNNLACGIILFPSEMNSEQHVHVIMVTLIQLPSHFLGY